MRQTMRPLEMFQIRLTRRSKLGIVNRVTRTGPHHNKGVASDMHHVTSHSRIIHVHRRPYHFATGRDDIIMLQRKRDQKSITRCGKKG